jgi:hypothetical protein
MHPSEVIVMEKLSIAVIATMTLLTAVTVAPTQSEARHTGDAHYGRYSGTRHDYRHIHYRNYSRYDERNIDYRNYSRIYRSCYWVRGYAYQFSGHSVCWYYY